MLWFASRWFFHARLEHQTNVQFPYSSLNLFLVIFLINTRNEKNFLNMQRFFSSWWLDAHWLSTKPKTEQVQCYYTYTRVCFYMTAAVNRKTCYALTDAASKKIKRRTARLKCDVSTTVSIKSRSRRAMQTLPFSGPLDGCAREKTD